MLNLPNPQNVTKEIFLNKVWKDIEDYFVVLYKMGCQLDMFEVARLITWCRLISNDSIRRFVKMKIYKATKLNEFKPNHQLHVFEYVMIESEFTKRGLSIDNIKWNCE